MSAAHDNIDGLKLLACPRWALGEPHGRHAWGDPNISKGQPWRCEGGPTEVPVDRPSDSVFPPFSGDDPTCPKCGNVGATTRYLDVGECQHTAGLVLGVHANERLHRECRRCDYAWDEATLPRTQAKP